MTTEPLFPDPHPNPNPEPCPGLHQPGGARLSLSGLRIFGLGPEGGAPPQPVATPSVRAVRDPADLRRATVTWDASDGSEFYVVRYGVAPHRSGGGGGGGGTADALAPLTHSYQVYGATSADIRALVGGVEYHVAVDAVNSNGVTLGTTQVPLMHAAQHSRKADASPG